MAVFLDHFKESKCGLQRAICQGRWSVVNIPLSFLLSLLMSAVAFCCFFLAVPVFCAILPSCIAIPWTHWLWDEAIHKNYETRKGIVKLALCERDIHLLQRIWDIHVSHNLNSFLAIAAYRLLLSHFISCVVQAISTRNEKWKSHKNIILSS